MDQQLINWQDVWLLAYGSNILVLFVYLLHTDGRLVAFNDAYHDIHKRSAPTWMLLCFSGWIRAIPAYFLPILGILLIETAWKIVEWKSGIKVRAVSL